MGREARAKRQRRTLHAAAPTQGEKVIALDKGAFYELKDAVRDVVEAEMAARQALASIDAKRAHVAVLLGPLAAEHGFGVEASNFRLDKDTLTLHVAPIDATAPPKEAGAQA